ncbi:DNA cytosine methyltransferase [Demequina lutea]|nr:DNA cytosine methyltransferase [Demequina lutea]
MLIPDAMPRDPNPAQLMLPDRVLIRREWDLKEDLPLDSATDVPGTALSADEVAWIGHWELMVQFMREWRRWQATSVGEAQRRLPGFPIWTDAWVATKKAREGLLEGAPAWEADFLRKNFDLFDALRGVDDKLVKGWLHDVRKFPESRRKLEWQAQDTQSLWGCVISFRPSGLRAKRMTHLPALVAITQTPVLGPLRRKLSAREAARLQGLPDGYSFEGQTDKATFKQMGNGVNTGVVWNVLKAHCARDRHLLVETPEGRAILEAVEGSPDNPPDALRVLFAAGVTPSTGA